MRFSARALLPTLLSYAPVLLFAVIIIVFGGFSERFLSIHNATNILTNAAHVAVMAIGMTFVLLVAGIDLSVGATMYLTAAALGLYLADASLPFLFLAAIAIGLAFGAINGLLVMRLKIAPFIITLATLFMGRGLALWLSDTRTVFLPEPLLLFGRDTLLGIPAVLWVLGIVYGGALFLLRLTPFGRRVYAIGADAEAAAKAGIEVSRHILVVYVLCGVCAALGGLISGSQVAAASSNFGYQKEFPVIAAAVLGGTSLFGGRGGVSGAIFGAVLIQTVENGLVMINADPYAYPLIVSAIIFVAVVIDSQRARVLYRMQRRRIRPEEADASDSGVIGESAR